MEGELLSEDVSRGERSVFELEVDEEKLIDIQVQFFEKKFGESADDVLNAWLNETVSSENEIAELKKKFPEIRSLSKNGFSNADVARAIIKHCMIEGRSDEETIETLIQEFSAIEKRVLH